MSKQRKSSDRLVDLILKSYCWYLRAHMKRLGRLYHRALVSRNGEAKRITYSDTIYLQVLLDEFVHTQNLLYQVKGPDHG